MSLSLPVLASPPAPAYRDKLVDFIEAGEVVPRLGRSVADRRHRSVQLADDFTDRNQTVFTLMHVSSTARIVLAVVRINRESAELLPCR